MVYERSFEGEFTHLSQMVKTEVVKSNTKFRSSELELERTLPIASAHLSTSTTM